MQKKGTREMMQLTKSRKQKSRMLALGILLAAVLASLMLVANPAHASTTFTVTNTNDNGPGSLRQAINDANDTSGADVIEFNIPGSGVHTIAPISALPKIVDAVTINGYTQPGAQPNGKVVGSDAVLAIQLSGANAGITDGLRIEDADSVVKGLAVNFWDTGIRIEGPVATGNRLTGNFIGTDTSGGQDLGNSRGVYIVGAPDNTVGGTTPAARNVISGNEGVGVNVDGGDGNVVAGNYIGTDASGAQDLGNAGSGINVEEASGSIIGGTTSGERNVVSGNDGSGVGLFGSGNKVIGNYVGTDATGTKALENGDAGVYASETNNTIGGTTAGARNVISANAQEGVEIYGAGATGNRVLGNYIGTDKSGTKALGNADQGVFIGLAPNNTVGGTSTGARNIISANGDSGVLIFGTEARGNKVLGNYIGTDKSGAAPLGNDYSGVVISEAPANTIGGTIVGAGNVISASTLDGVEISGDTATGNRILSNSIYANGDLGIDLGDDGLTANDPGDADTGANYLQNFPLLSSARKNASGTTTVRGKLNSTPEKTFRVQLFSNPKGTNEGKTLLGSQLVSTDGSGDATFAFSTKKPIRVGQNITATATGPGGNTSEFSAPKQVVAS
jgi:titin